MKADVYRNLTKRCMSIRSRERASYGRVVEHSSLIYMKNCKFIVNQAGRAKVLKTKRKNVHAFVRGEVMSSWGLIEKGNFLPPFPVDGWVEVTYNPYISETFVVKDWNEDYSIRVSGAENVYIMNNKVYAKGLLGV